MLRLKQVFQNKRGFTLIELVLGIFLTSMILITLLTSLSFILEISERNLQKDEILLNGRYISEYIKEEISKSNIIIASSLFNNLDSTFPTNIGFVTLRIYQDTSEFTNTYSYTTYYFKENTIVRINAKRLEAKADDISSKHIRSNLPKAASFSGYNSMGEDILRESTISLGENNIVYFDLFFKSIKTEISNFKSNIFVRCEVMR